MLIISCTVWVLSSAAYYKVAFLRQKKALSYITIALLSLSMIFAVSGILARIGFHSSSQTYNFDKGCLLYLGMLLSLYSAMFVVALFSKWNNLTIVSAGGVVAALVI